MGRRPAPAQPDGKVDNTRPKTKKKSRRKAISIPDPPPAGDEPGSSREIIAPKTGMKFKTLEELCEFYNRYAQHLGFATKIKGSSRNRAYIQIMCWKGRKRDIRRTDALAPRPTLYTSCPALLKVRLCRFDGMYHLKEVVLDHNHELNPLRMHFYRDENMVGAGVKKREAHVAVVREDSLAMVEREWMSSVDEIQWLKLEKEDAEALHQFFRRKQANNSNFFYLIDIDGEGHLKNVFWADGRSRAAYRYFGDVILLDTSCLRSKHNVPLATFIGINHHGQPLLMGCGLLSNENTRTYIWLFRAWLSCMSGKSPNAIITDQGKAIQEAVAQVFPGCPHRQCLWQIMKRIPNKLEGCAEYKEIKKAFKKTVYDSLSAHEFEQEWRKMIEKHNLVYNEWLRLLYQDRYHWAPIFVKDKFWAGLSTTQRGENMDFFFEGHLESNTSLKQFLDEYEMAMESKYETEALADFESFHKVPPVFTQFYMEEQLSKIYTIDIFVKFQDEVKALVYCHPSLIRKDGLMYIFEVRERIRGKEGKMMEQKNYEVMFNPNDQEAQCICHSFQYRGILCRHVLSVFNFQDIDEIPSWYIVERWKKDFKGVHPVVCPPYEMVANGPMERYENLYKHCLKLAEVGTITDDKYQFVLKIVNEAMEKLLVDNFTCKGKQVKIVMTEPTIDCNTVDSSAINDNDDMGKEIEEIRDPKEARKKGRKKRKESAETLNSNKEKEQVNQTNAPVFLHPPLHLNFQHPFANPSWAQWNFQHMNQVQPSNLIYYAAAPVNHPQFGLFLNKDQLGDPRFTNSSGIPWSSQQILEKTQNPVALPGPKKKKKRKNDVVELSP
ncbi:protein FAR1-RELATED SEQUENCE 6-like [Phoenix dactylifera]|uniref:Protein FAR1-RELATED SEQUENCE n=1 Tax=Phoenix dactylifera TaxID=42345 RepID=A0A8B7MT72_PHODC|nr:protein FAR1-RELATED SEQUENCE 6-like [Phoenix dactylifera]XP_017697331.2 protein FAR1-RELATED SEQUENCE 6-like [Phoenix dactylifera]